MLVVILPDRVSVLIGKDNSDWCWFSYGHTGLDYNRA
jgi:hypothetical protein